MSGEGLGIRSHLLITEMPGVVGCMVAPQKIRSSPNPPVSVNVTLFGNRVFADEITLDLMRALKPVTDPYVRKREGDLKRRDKEEKSV